MGSVHKEEGGGVPGAGDGGEGEEGEEEGGSASLSFVVLMLLAVATARLAPDWWEGLNCKVHAGPLMAGTCRL